MDRKSPDSREIQRLIELSADARACLRGEVCALRRRLDVPARLRDSLQHHPASWLFGSLASGLAASWVFRRKPPTPKPARAIPAKMLGVAWRASQPLVKIWLGNQVKNWLAGQPLPEPASRWLSRLSPTFKSR